MPPSLIRRHLARDISIVLAAKVALITLAAIFLFDSGRSVPVDAAAVMQKFLGPIPPA